MFPISGPSPNGGADSGESDRDLPLNQGRDTFIFATTAQESWHEESWTTEGSVSELRGFYAGFHPHARALLDACDSVLKTALYERDPLAQWSQGRVSLLGMPAIP